MLSKVFTTNKGQMIMPSPNYILHSTQQQFYCQTHCSNICKKTLQQRLLRTPQKVNVLKLEPLQPFNNGLLF